MGHKNPTLVALTVIIRTQREVERRQMLIDNLITKEKQINEAFKNEGSNSR